MRVTPGLRVDLDLADMRAVRIGRVRRREGLDRGAALLGGGGQRREIGVGDRPVGAGDADAAVGDFEILRRGFERVGREVLQRGDERLSRRGRP